MYARCHINLLSLLKAVQQNSSLLITVHNKYSLDMEINSDFSFFPTKYSINFYKKNKKINGGNNDDGTQYIYSDICAIHFQ